MEKSKHSIAAMIFHWGFVFIFIYGILKQVEDINQLSDISLLKFEIIFAALMLILLIIRYFYMSRTQVLHCQRIPQCFKSEWQRLYILVFILIFL